MKRKLSGNKVLRLLGAAFGASLFAAAYKVIVLPMGFYNGGLTGICQIIQELLLRWFGLRFGFDITGILYWILNIPIFLLSWRSLGRRFFLSSAVITCFQSLVMTVIPVPASPILNDFFTASVVAGLLAGFGIGLMLTCGSSGGGVDILGMYFTLKFKNMSVGRLSIFVDVSVYIYGLFHAPLEIIIYSVIYCLVSGLMTDRFHYQNIKIAALIISRSPGLEKLLLHDLERGVTIWNGVGGYTGEPTKVYYALVSRYEARRLKTLISATDPNAFVVFSQADDHAGSFEKHFDV